MELDEHVPVYVLEPEHPKYHAPSDDGMQVEDDDEDPKEDHSKEHEPKDDDEDTEEDPNEENEPEDKDTKEPFEDSDETESFEEDETTITPPPRNHGARIYEDMTPRRRFVLTAPLPGCDVAESSAAAARAPRSQYDFVDTVKAGQGLIRCLGHDTQTISRAADRSEDVGYVRALQAYEHIRVKIDVVRGQRTTYETELQEVHQAYVSSEAQNKALLVRLKTLETHVSRMKWQRQSPEDLAVTQMIRIHVLEAKAQTDTVEDASSSSGFENCPPMLNKENYVRWSSRLLRYAKSIPNEKFIHNSIINGPYVRRMILKPGDPNREVPVNETFHVQTDDEITKKELKQIKADDQAIQTILLGLPKDIYAAVDSCKTAQEIWLRVQQMMKGSDSIIQEKKAKLCNEWERFTSTDGESIESYYHHFLKLMNDFKRINTFQKSLPNYMQQLMPNPEDITYPTTAMNMELDLMAKAFRLNSSTPTNNNQRISSNLHNRQIAQSGMKMGQDRRMQMVRGNDGNQFRQYVRQNAGNLNGYNAVQNVENQNLNKNGNLVAARAGGNATGHNGNHIRCYNCRGLGYFARNYTVRPRRRDVAYLQTQLRIAQKKEARIQLQAKEFDLMAVAADLDEIKEVNENCILMANLQQPSTSGTQTNKAPIYDSDGSVELHNNDNFYDNELFNMFTQEEQYTELLKPILEPHEIPQNVNNVILEVFSMEQSGGTVEQHPANVEETHVLYDSLYNNLAIEVKKVNTVNRKLRETNAELTTELVRYKTQEKCFEISHEKYDKLERCYQKSVYQEQCLTKKINALHLSSGKQITTLNEEILDLNKQLSMEKSKSREELYFSNTSKTADVSKPISISNEEFSDDTTPSVARKFLNEVKRTIVTLQRVVKHRMTLDTHNWSSSAHQELHKIVKDEIFLIVNQVDARVQNFEILFLKEAAKFVRDFKSLAKEANESLAKHKALELEIERLLRAIVSQDIMSIVQNNCIVDSSNLPTELDCTKAKLENCIIKKEKEYVILWNKWYIKCKECKYEKILYDKAYNDMQQKIKRLQAQLGDLKGKSKDTSCVSDTLNPLSQ
nr:hypothetical protein [Tanacetum cinerariifolium]